VLTCFGAAVAFGIGFVIREVRAASPMLNLRFFQNPRFSVASIAISLAFFALFGALFALTQFLQDAHGYSALEAGAAMVPITFGLITGAGSSIKLVARFGTRKVLSTGLMTMSAVLASSLLWTYDMPYWPLAIWFYFLAVSMGWIMGPATASVMGSVPEEKSGVASAMNDVTRQVAGALGTAVIGSLITSLYVAKLGDATSSLPASGQAIAEGSVGQAQALAEGLPAATGADLSQAASVAFTDALGIGFLAAAAAGILAAAAVRRWLPRDQEGESPAVQEIQREATEPSSLSQAPA
jgi:predicted MFS family arabinose efflux permease